MLARVTKKLRTFTKLDLNAELQRVLMGTEIQENIIYLNTEKQLFESGEDKLGRTLESLGGGYRPYTIQIKLSKGQPIDRVTLKDTGDFYDSFRVIVPKGADYIEITANPFKDGKDINNEWGGHVVGLNPDNLQLIIDEVLEKLLLNIKDKYKSA